MTPLFIVPLLFGVATSSNLRATTLAKLATKWGPTRTLDDVGFDRPTAERVLGLTAAAYCGKEQIESWDCPACEGNLESVRVTDAQDHSAFVGWDSQEAKIRVVFRGSVSAVDWQTDFEHQPTNPVSGFGCADCSVHSGFYQMYQALEPGVSTNIRALLEYHPDAVISVTGHSLGAGVAVLAAADYKFGKQWNVEDTAYTFGQPRVGNENFARWFGKAFPNWFRSVHWQDPVPHLDRLSLVYGNAYQHSSLEIWWDEASENACVGDGSGEDPNCSRVLEPAANIINVFLRLYYDWSDHCNYLGLNNCDCQPLR